MTTYANGEPEPIVQELINLLPAHSHVLDIGCGEGRNAIPLARAGMRVEGWDKCREEIATMVLRATHENLKINPVSCDMRDIRVGYDRWSAILTILCMHFLRPQEAEERLLRIRSTILPGGYHAMVALTDNGTLADLRKKQFFFPSIEELLKPYEGWEIVSKDTRVVPCKTSDREGLENERVAILARKPLQPTPSKPL